MKFMLKLYRLLKPAAIYTSYLFTILTLLYLTGQMVFPQMPEPLGYLGGRSFQAPVPEEFRRMFPETDGQVAL